MKYQSWKNIKQFRRDKVGKTIEIILKIWDKSVESGH
jgi:hypothetical protein